MKIAVIGGNSYLASILRILKDKRCKFTFFSRKLSKNTKKISFTSYKNLEKKLKKFDYLIHLIGMNKLDSSKENKSVFIKKDITEKVSNICKKNNIKLIYISSVQIYKNFEKLKKINIFNPLEKKKNYSKAHKIAEDVISKKFKGDKNNYVIIRLTNVFGHKISMTNLNKENIINNFCNSALKKGVINIHKPWLARNFIPSRVFNELILKVLNTKKLNNEIVNFGYKTYDLKKVSEIISKRFEKIYKNKIKIKYRKYKKKKLFKIENNKFKINFNKKIFNNDIDETLINLYGK